jgi:hypothetical protein
MRFSPGYVETIVMTPKPPERSALLFQETAQDGLLMLPAASIGRGPLFALALLEQRFALQYSGILTELECADLIRTIYEGRAHWTPNFEGVQFTLGRAFYTHLEEDREEDYFRNPMDSDAVVRSFAPGLQERITAAVRLLVEEEVQRRPGFCGAGVHIFPAGGLCAQQGGDLHFDTEGLTEEQLETDAPAFTCVLMLQPPQAGGGLRVWNKTYAGEETVDESELPSDSVLCTYRAGDLVVIDSRRLHQILPFSGSLDRVSATLHAVYNSTRELWEVWF